MICPVCGKGELEMDHIWHGQDVSISHLACVEKMQDGAKRLVASNERLLKRAEKAEAALEIERERPCATCGDVNRAEEGGES